MNFQNGNEETKDASNLKCKFELYANSTLSNLIDKSFLEYTVRKDDILYFSGMNPINLLRNLSDNRENFTLIHLSAQSNSFRLMACFLQIIKLQLKLDPQVIAYTQNSGQGDTPAIICVKNNHPETLLILMLEDCVDFNVKNRNKSNLNEVSEAKSTACNHFLSSNWAKDRILKTEDKIFLCSQFIHFFEYEYQNLKIENFFDLKSYNYKSKESIDKLRGQNTISKASFASKISIIDQSIQNRSKVLKFTWLRYHQILKKNIEKTFLFDLSWSASNIKQGEIENCYLIAALISLSQFPQRMLKIFSNDKINLHGLYELHFYDRGVPLTVFADDFFPVYNSKKSKPNFANTENFDLCPLLIEKAYSAIYGSYFACEHGYSDEAIETLLGCPTIQFVFSSINEESLWDYLSRAVDRNFIITLTTLKNASETSDLPDCHAYSLIAVYQFDDIKLIKLRDPRSNLKWKCKYHKKSKLWSSEMLTEVGDISPEKGLFCATIDELKSLFEYASVGLYEDGYHYHYLEYELDKQLECFATIKVKESCNLYLRLHQEDLRKKHKKAVKKSDYRPVELFIAMLDDSGTMHPLVSNSDDLDSNSNWGARTIFGAESKVMKLSQPGEYVVRAKIIQKNDTEDPITISTYSSSDLELTFRDNQKNFLEEFFKAIGRGSKTKKEIKPRYSRAEEFYGNYCWFYFENTGDKLFKIKFEILFLENLEFLNFEVGNKEILVQRTSSKVLILKKNLITKAASYQFKWNYSFDDTQ